MGSEPYPLTDAYWKTERAKVHLNDLKVACDCFVDSTPYSIVPNEEPERDAIRYEVAFHHPHVSIFLIAADFIQCLRTALDQAVWSLASMRFSDPDWTQFPVLPDDPAKKDWDRFKKQTRGIPPEAIEIIKSLQPHNRPTGVPISVHPLWRIHELNRIEKHRRIPVMTMGAAHYESVFSAGVLPRFSETKATDNGCEITKFGVGKALQPTLTPLIVFGARNIGLVIGIGEAEELYNFVANEVLPRLVGCAQE